MNATTDRPPRQTITFMNTDSHPEPRDKTITWTEYVVITGVLASALVVILYLCVFAGHLSPDPAAWGQFGDYFGGTLNPILGVLGLFGLYYTIQLQIKAIKDTQQQFLREQFENRFFQLLGLLNEPRSKVDFATLANAVSQSRSSNTAQKPPDEKLREAILNSCDQHFNDYQQQICGLLLFLRRGQDAGRVSDDFFTTATARLLSSDEKVMLVYATMCDAQLRELACQFPILAGLKRSFVYAEGDGIPHLDRLIGTAPLPSQAPPSN
jgi:hypothetical protein